MRVADGRGDARAGHLAELDRGHADAAGGAVDEQPLAARSGPACVKSASWAVVKTSGTPPAAVQSSSSGTGIAVRSWTTASSAWPPPATIAITRSPGSKRRRRRPQVDDLAGELEAGDVLRRARRRRVVAGELHHVGAVEPGGADADEQLAVLGLGVGVLGDLDPAVADGGGAHGGEGTPGRSCGCAPGRCIMRIGTYLEVRTSGRISLPRTTPPLWRESAPASRPPRCFRSSVWRGGGVPDGDGPPGPADPRLHGRRRVARRR